MANGMTLKIGSSFDNKGVKQAQSGVKNISESFKNLKKAIGGLAIGAAIGQIKRLSDETAAGFRKQNAELVKLNKSLINNSKLSGEACKNIIAMTGSVSKIFTGDMVANATALASNMGLTEKQIIEVMGAAQDLAASGVMPLDQAVKTLSQSYSGQTGQLGKLLPETKQLTKEQLKNGEAVKLVAEQYKGLAKDMESTFSGRQSVFDNAIGDLKNSVGGVFASLAYEAQGQLIPIINKVTGWIEKHRQQIINIILHLPELAKIALNTIGDLVVKTFSKDGFINLFTLVGELLVTSMKSSFTIVWSLIQDVVVNALKFVKEAIENIGVFFNNMFMGVGNKIIEVLNTIIQKAMQQPAIKWLYEKLSGNKASDVKIDFKFEKKEYNDLKKSAADVFTGVKNFAKTYKDAVVEQTKDTTEALNNFGQFYGDITNGMVEKFSEVVNQDLPEGLSHAFEMASASYAEKQKGEMDGKKTDSGLTDASDNLKSVFSMFGQLGQLIQGIMSSNWIGLLIQFLATLVSNMSEKSESFKKFLAIFDTLADKINNSGMVEAFDKIFTPLVDIVETLGSYVGRLLEPLFKLVGDVLGPLFEFVNEILLALNPIIECLQSVLSVLGELFGGLLTDLLQSLLPPLVEIISILAQMLSPLLNRLIQFAPVIEFVGGILSGVAKVIGTIFSWIATAVGTVYDWIYKVLDFVKIPKVSFEWKSCDGWWSWLNYPSFDIGWSSLAGLIGMNQRSTADAVIEEAKTQNANAAYNPDGIASTTTSSSASYTAAKDVYVNIYYNNSYVNGDAEAIAVNLAKEIKRAESMNRI